MAGIFGDEISSRGDFQRELEVALQQHENAPKEHRNDAVIVRVGRQLRAIAGWTKDGGEPTKAERKSITMGVELHREYEYTDDDFLYNFHQCVSGVSNYVRHWPTDEDAADADNFDRLWDKYIDEMH
ncbi:MAG: hypothetical protein JKY37_06790 [Nannocystaceae bacterium]|nr:hypothetical protein [Nannocystaceae bacterium]